MRRHRRGQDRASRARRDTDLRARPRGGDRAPRRAAALLHRARAGARARPAAVRGRRYAADLLGRRRPVVGPRRRRRDARVRSARAGDEVDRPGRHRRLDQADLQRAGQGRLRLRLLPRVPQGGLGAPGLLASRTGSWSATTATGRATRSSSCTRRSRAADAYRHPQRRDDQARRQRVPGHEDLVHQRDRQCVRGDRRRRARGGARDGSRPADRDPLPQARDRLRRLLLPQGRLGAQAARRATLATTSSC